MNKIFQIVYFDLQQNIVCTLEIKNFPLKNLSWQIDSDNYSTIKEGIRQNTLWILIESRDNFVYLSCLSR